MNNDPLPKLQFRLLGAPQLYQAGVVHVGLTAAKALALLSYLAMTASTGRTTHTRAALATLLWGECGEAEARGNLRKVIQHLREQLDPYLTFDNQTVGLRTPHLYTVDAVDFAAALADPRTAALDQLQAAIAQYHGDFLEGFYVRDAPDFEAWMLGERARLRELMLQGVETLALRYADQGDLPQAITTARRLLALEPWREEMHRQLMTWLAQNGQRSAALAQYELCQRALAEELAVEPSGATRDLYERLLRQDATEPQTLLRSAPVEYALVGRQQAWQTLRTAWRQVRQTGTHFVCIAGEAGIGKTRLAEELLIDVQRQGHAAARTRTYALEGRLAYGPVAEWLRTETLRPHLTKLNKIWLSEVARLLPGLLAEQPELPAPSPLTERWQQKQLFEALVQAFTAAGHPLLLLLDDLQWCDPETLDWLHYLLGAAPQAPILLVGTMRNDEMDDDHPLYKLGHHLRREGKLTMIDLTPLSAQETAALGAQVAMQGLDADAIHWLYQETAGNPLFVVECVRAGLRQEDRETGKQRDGGEGFSLSELPPKVFGVMQARLAQLSSEAHALAQLAATVGRAFTVELLIQAGHQDEATVVRSLDELWRRRLLREQTPGTYDFSHDRLRDVAYTEMSPIRRRLLHQRIAQALEQVYSANLDAVSGQVAAQYELAGALEQAVLYYQQAADAARRIYAKREVAHYLQKGLTLLNALPNTPAHLQQELEIQVDLAAVLMSIEGLASPAAEKAYVRAFDLGQQVEMTTHLFPTLWGLHEVYLFQAKAEPARALAAQCMAIAQREQAPALLLQAHHACWSVLLYLSPPDLPLALAHAEAGIALYHPQQHHAHVFHYGGHDPGQCARLIAAEALWLLGYPDQALLRSQEALELGRQLSHPGTLEFALHGLTYIRIHRREIHAIPELTALSIAINLELEMPMGVAVGMIQQGWALVMQGDSDQGLPQIRQGVEEWLALGLVFRQSHHWVLLAEAYARAGQPEAGLAAIEEAQAAADVSGERYLEAEMYRLHGELLLATGRAINEAEGAFQQALTTARQQQAKSLELRATVSLCRLWQQQGRIREARQLLAEIYHWFTEGFDTTDLREAKTLLDELQCAENVEACLHPSCVEQLAL